MCKLYYTCRLGHGIFCAALLCQSKHIELFKSIEKRHHLAHRFQRRAPQSNVIKGQVQHGLERCSEESRHRGCRATASVFEPKALPTSQCANASKDTNRDKLALIMKPLNSRELAWLVLNCFACRQVAFAENKPWAWQTRLDWRAVVARKGRLLSCSQLAHRGLLRNSRASATQRHINRIYHAKAVRVTLSESTAGDDRGIYQLDLCLRCVAPSQNLTGGERQRASPDTSAWLAARS